MATMQENDTGPSPDDEKAAVSLTSADDTTSASSGVAANADFEEEDEDENPMPLLNYSRLSSSSSSSSSPGSTSSRKHTCSTMARVWLDPMEDTESTAATITPSNPTTTADGEQQQENNPQLLLKSDLWKQQPHWIMAVGMSDGSVSLISVDGGTEVLSAPQSLTVAEGDREENPVIDVSLDSSGKVLAAIDASGTCAIWELQYSVKYHTAEQELVEEQPTRRRSSTTSTTAPHSQEGNMFSSFMSALTGVPPPPPPPPPPSAETSNSNNINNNNSNENTTTSTRTTTMLVPKLTATIIQTSRITYPQNWSTPSCLALDPAHKRKREKSLLVGFEDGRLLLTKRGGLFQRRNDTVLYQGSPGGENSNSSSESYRGIQAVAWRGNLVAWADVTGMKLLEVETLTRVAHIDRPTGARPTLYPTISNFRPHLHFEQSTKLLVAWGDCLMEMNIETVVDATNADAKRKTVECIMAWELDCVACGVSPLDENHVVVLGLVPPEDDDENGEKTNDENDLEVQIVRRQDGTVRYCDSLPLAGSSAKGSPYTLLSSFALPRMEDAFELEEFLKHGGMDQQPDLADMGSLFATGEGSRNKTPKFRDCHLDWNVENILFEEEEEEEDMNSVDSDDYEFVLRPIIDVSSDQEDRTRPPLLVVACASDLVLARVSSVDDAVAHALSQNKCALALSRGLRHRRQLRRFDSSNLVNHYLEAVLQLSPAEEADEGEEGSPLSLRRMQLAVQAMPVLLGGRIDLWKRWAAELERIPGSLFLLRNYLPVRDPILPPDLYERMLEKMLLEIEQLSAAKRDEAGETDTVRFDHEAAAHFLESLVAWGPTKNLKEFIKLYKYSRERRRKGDKSTFRIKNKQLKTAEISLQRRYLQTAAGYLNFPVANTEEELEGAVPRYDANKDDSLDSLYRIDKMIQLVSSGAPLVALPEEDHKGAAESPSSLAPNNPISLEAIAELRMMQNRNDLALQCFLAIGACHSPLSMSDLEAMAVGIVNGVSGPKTASTPILVGSSSYEFVLGIIEFNHLHQLLLDKDFILSTDSKLFMPLFALLRLIGLPLMGQFLMDHCVPPEWSSSESWPERGRDAKSNNLVRRETLPIDCVAEQLEHSPALLHWYLHLVFTKKPELYVKFPNNSIPPKSIIELHRKHFKLYVDFAGEDKDSVKSLSGTEPYKIDAKTTPLLSFLKAALPLGGVLPVDARRQLEIQRSQGTEDSDDDEAKDEPPSTEPSHSFSLELAYIIENYSEQTEAEAIGILDLYLKGANSLMLAVSYAQRQRKYSSILWDKLINFCLTDDREKFGDFGKAGQDGILFGALLEAAALSGADLARLVARIPPGMIVEGLRPRLVAAVADYRLKLDIHQAAAAAAGEERISLLRQVTHRSRRGTRYNLAPPVKKTVIALASVAGTEEEMTQDMSVLPNSLKTVERRDRHSLAYSIPMR